MLVLAPEREQLRFRLQPAAMKEIANALRNIHIFRLCRQCCAERPGSFQVTEAKSCRLGPITFDGDET